MQPTSNRGSNTSCKQTLGIQQKGDLCVFDGWEKLQGVKKRPNAKSLSPKELSLLSLWSRRATFGPVRLGSQGTGKGTVADSERE